MNTFNTARKPLTDEGAQVLAAAIIQRAIDDWFDAHHRIFKLKKKREKRMAKATSPSKRDEVMLRYGDEIREQKREIRKIEFFFDSELCSAIMAIDKDSILAILQAQLKEKIEAWSKEKPSNRPAIVFGKVCTEEAQDE